jgi:hypothetical protein
MSRLRSLEIIATFSSAEKKKFREFLSSPFFNANKTIIRLYDLVSGRKKPLDISKQELFRKLFPGKKYNDGRLRLLLHRLNVLAEKFLVVRRILNDKFAFTSSLSRELIDRELYPQFETASRRMTAYVQSDTFQDENYFWTCYISDYNNLLYLERVNLQMVEKFFSEVKFNEIFNNLTCFYLLRSLRLYVYILNTRTIFDVNLNTDAPDRIIFNLAEEEYKKIPVLDIYYNLVMLLLERDPERAFDKLNALLKENKKSLGRADLQNIYINMENYCQRKIRSGHPQYQKLLFDLYKNELTDVTFLEFGFMPVLFFKGVVTSGLKLKELEWVKKFIDEYQPMLPAAKAHSTVKYCTALYNFYAGNFEKSLESLALVKYEDLYLKLDGKLLQAMLYYELSLFDSLESHLDSFRHFLTNNKLIPAARKTSFVNFYKYLNKLSKLSNERNGTLKEELRDCIEKEPRLAFKEWFLEKL